MKLDELFLHQPHPNALYLFETQSTGKFNVPDQNTDQHYRQLIDHGKQIGNIGPYHVVQDEHDGVYLVGLIYFEGQKNKGPVAFVKFQTKTLFGKQYIDIILIHSLSTRYKQLAKSNLIIPLLTFLKTHYNLPFIDLTGYQSDKAISLIRWVDRIQLTNVKWINIKTGEEQQYNWKVDSPKNSPFRSASNKTDWRIVAESAGTFGVDDYSLHEALLHSLCVGVRNTEMLADEN